MICITDSDFLIAQVMKSDIHNKKALEISKRLSLKKANVLYPATAIIEAATAIQRKYNNPKLAHALLNLFKEQDLQVISVSHETVIKTASSFNPASSKHNTPFDYAVLSLAKSNKANIILSFDEFYKNKGFKTPSDF